MAAAADAGPVSPLLGIPAIRLAGLVELRRPFAADSVIYMRFWARFPMLGGGDRGGGWCPGWRSPGLLCRFLQTHSHLVVCRLQGWLSAFVLLDLGGQERHSAQN